METARGISGFVCRRCGACCRIEDGIVRVSAAEIGRIAAFLGMAEQDFIDRETEVAPDRRGLVLKSRPDGACAWLSGDNLCRINPVKPDKCRTFPHEWTNGDSDRICPGLAASVQARQACSWFANCELVSSFSKASLLRIPPL